MKLKELLAVVEEIKKDLSYIRSLEERWQKERRRFPILFEHIRKQAEFFRQKMQTLFEVEVAEASLDEYLRWRMQVARQPSSLEKPVVELQTLEAAAAEAAKLREEKEKEDAKRLAEKVRQTVKQHLPQEVKDAEKLKELGTQIADEIEGGKK